jgi:hypothetical protein
VAAFVLLIVVARLATVWGAGAADAEAARRAGDMRSALAGHTPADLLVAMLPSFNGKVPGGPYDFVESRPSGAVRAGVGIRKGLQARCVRAELAADGALSVTTTHKGC